MGGGDIKLLAMIGAWLGWQSLPFVIFASSFSGTLVGLIAMLYQKKGGRTRIPFGPFLSLAALVYTFYSENILYFFHLYLNRTMAIRPPLQLSLSSPRATLSTSGLCLIHLRFTVAIRWIMFSEPGIFLSTHFPRNCRTRPINRQGSLIGCRKTIG